MKKLSTLVLIFALAGAALADKESIDELKARVERSNPKDQVELCTKIAQRQVDTLDKAYNAGDVQQARAALADVVTYGVRAAQQAAQTGKRMKQTEIAMRKMSARLEGIRRSLDLDERTPVGDAISKLEKARTELLNRMFRK
jgi:hypothetical protein